MVPRSLTRSVDGANLCGGQFCHAELARAYGNSKPGFRLGFAPHSLCRLVAPKFVQPARTMGSWLQIAHEEFP